MTDSSIEFLVKRQSCLIIDACCLVCLHASGHLREVLAVTAARIAVPEYVRNKEILDFEIESYCEDQTLTVAKPDDLIYASVTDDFASQRLDNGEAFVGAFAKRYRWAIATDDKLAARIFAKDMPDLQVVDTPMMIKHWADQHCPPNALLLQMLVRIQELGHYKPKPKHPLRSWWQEKLIVKEKYP